MQVDGICYAHKILIKQTLHGTSGNETQTVVYCLHAQVHACTHTYFSVWKKLYTALIIHNANYPSRIQNNVIYILKQYTNIHTVVKFCKLEKIHIRSHYRYGANRKRCTSSVVSHSYKNYNFILSGPNSNSNYENKSYRN